jgi:hypothetical protein
MSTSFIKVASSGLLKISVSLIISTYFVNHTVACLMLLGVLTGLAACFKAPCGFF